MTKLSLVDSLRAAETDLDAITEDITTLRSHANEKLFAMIDGIRIVVETRLRAIREDLAFATLPRMAEEDPRNVLLETEADLRAEVKRLQIALYGTDSFNPGAEGYAAMYANKCEELDAECTRLRLEGDELQRIATERETALHIITQVAYKALESVKAAHYGEAEDRAHFERGAGCGCNTCLVLGVLKALEAERMTEKENP